MYWSAYSFLCFDTMQDNKSKECYMLHCSVFYIFLVLTVNSCRWNYRLFTSIWLHYWNLLNLCSVQTTLFIVTVNTCYFSLNFLLFTSVSNAFPSMGYYNTHSIFHVSIILYNVVSSCIYNCYLTDQIPVCCNPYLIFIIFFNYFNYLIFYSDKQY